MLKDHPVIEKMERYGYMEPEPKPLGRDTRGVRIMPGDVLIEFEDSVYVEEELLSETIEILKYHGATRKIAQ